MNKFPFIYNLRERRKVSGQVQMRFVTSYNNFFKRVVKKKNKRFFCKNNNRVYSFKILKIFGVLTCIKGSKLQRLLSKRNVKNKTEKLQKYIFSNNLNIIKKYQHYLKWCTFIILFFFLGEISVKLWEDIEKGFFKDEEKSGKKTIRAESWKIYIYSSLPLKEISRMWGYVNSLNLPTCVRAPLFKLYSKVFGVNMTEIENSDLTTYLNLAEFFYRRLKPDMRPISKSELVSPSDGTVIRFGEIKDDEIEQVKGKTYSLDALLGLKKDVTNSSFVGLDCQSSYDDISSFDSDFVEMHELNSQKNNNDTKKNILESGSKSNYSNMAYTSSETCSDEEENIKRKIMDNDYNKLFFAVIYLSPGDYHRFHSPTNWVTTLRRHFIGELFSVSPSILKKISNLFVLNERVALLGYWKHGFFSMVPIGATNVGSIIINFDKELRTNRSHEYKNPQNNKINLLNFSLNNIQSSTNEVNKSTFFQKISEKKKKLKKNSVYEMSYNNANNLLKGYPLKKGQEVGGFKFGSSIILVFEAPKNFTFDLKINQKVKMGQSLGFFN